MFYSQVILAKKGPLAKVWLAAHWGDKKLARPQIFATDISQSCTDIMNPSVPLALRLSGHLLLGVVRIYSRKVRYVLNDCTEAMLKLQTAFSKSGQKALEDSGGRELLPHDASGGGHQLVANFGEFDRVHVVEGFCLPLPEDNEWILADDDDDDDEAGPKTPSQRDPGVLLAAHLPTQSHSVSPGGGGGFGEDDEPEEAWAPFDPDEEEDEHMEGLPSNSRVSDIEVVRAANDSLLSEDQTRRSTSLLDPDKSALSENAPGDAAKNPEDEEDYDFNVPFEDSEDEEGKVAHEGGPGTPGGLNDSALELSRDGGTPLGTNALGLGLDDSPAVGAKRPSPTPPRRRRRKRRKVVIDNHATELTNEHIRAMLRDTDDLVAPMVHPASLWDDSAGGSKTYRALVLEERARQQPPSEKSKRSKDEAVPSLTQPFVADAGELHPVLARLWQDNYWKALGNPCPYPRREAAEEMEEVRKAETEEPDDDDATQTSDLNVDKDAKPTKTGDEEEEEEEDFPTAFDDEEEEEEQDVPVPDFDDEEEDVALRRVNADDDDDLLELGMVNDMVLDSDEDNALEDSDAEQTGRQALGDVASSATKWHKHTVRVFAHLKKCLKDPSADNEDEEDEANAARPETVRFHELTQKVVTRRNASAVFFEMLQLKTWDFIEVDQDEAYGAISISAGTRFSEPVPGG